MIQRGLMAIAALAFPMSAHPPGVALSAQRAVPREVAARPIRFDGVYVSRVAGSTAVAPPMDNLYLVRFHPGQFVQTVTLRVQPTSKTSESISSLAYTFRTNPPPLQTASFSVAGSALTFMMRARTAGAAALHYAGEIGSDTLSLWVTSTASDSSTLRTYVFEPTDLMASTLPADANDTSASGRIAQQMVRVYVDNRPLHPLVALSLSVDGAEKVAMDDAQKRLWNAGLAITGDRLSGEAAVQVTMAYVAWLRSRRPMTAEKGAMYVARFQKIDKATIDAWHAAEANSGTRGNSRMLTIAAIAFHDFLFEGGDWKDGNPARALRRLGSLSRDAVDRWKAAVKGGSSEETPFAAYSLIAVDPLFSGDEFQPAMFNSAVALVRAPSPARPDAPTPRLPDAPFEELLVAAASPDRATKIQAISALGRSADPRAASALFELLQKPDSGTQRLVIPMFCKGGDTEPRAIDAMIEFMKANRVPGSARSCLLMTSDKRAVGPIIDDLTPPDARVFPAAARWLKAMTGQEFATVKEWQDWWRSNKEQFNKR
jgi:hypothetical protein